jgi:TRAP-type C4-dicarboxylate transport system substrate-binding protein
MHQPPRSSRRQFHERAAAVPIAALAAACEPRAIDGRTVVYASGFSLPRSADEQLWLEFEQRLESQLPDFDVRLLIRGETGPEEQMLAMLRRGRLQIAGGSFAGVATLVPEIALLSVPFLFDSEHEVDFVMDRYMLEPFRELFAAQGLRLMQWTDVGWVNLYGQQPLPDPDDLRGRRIRASSSIASQAFVAALGADTITMPFSDVVPSLQTGLIEGGVTSTTMYSLSGILNEAPHFVLTHHSYDMGAMLANGRWFAGLDAPAQRVVDGSFGGAANARRTARESVEALERTLPERGVRLYQPTAAQREAWRRAAWPAHRRLVERIGGEAERIYSTLTAGVTAYRSARGGGTPAKTLSTDG